jgi:hypothetical protein
VSDTISLTDAMYRERMTLASIWLRDAILLARKNDPRRPRPDEIAPENLRWGKTWLPDNWRPVEGSETSLELARRVAKHIERDVLADTLRVSRDPCPLCAVRADIGCKHNRRAA